MSHAMMNYRSFANAVKHNNRYIHDRNVLKFLCRVRSLFSDHAETLTKGLGVWRAALGFGYECDWIGKDPDGDDIIEPIVTPWGKRRLTPDPSKAKENRANPRGIACFYGASTEKIAIPEVRPWVGADVSVGFFEITKEIKIVDFRPVPGLEQRRKSRSLLHRLEGSFPDQVSERPLTRKEVEESVWDDINEAFSLPVPNNEDPINYIPTQIIAELVKREGYKGIAYESVFARGEGVNIALYDLRAVELKWRRLVHIDMVKVKPNKEDIIEKRGVGKDVKNKDELDQLPCARSLASPDTDRN